MVASSRDTVIVRVVSANVSMCTCVFLVAIVAHIKSS